MECVVCASARIEVIPVGKAEERKRMAEEEEMRLSFHWLWGLASVEKSVGASERFC